LFTGGKPVLEGAMAAKATAASPSAAMLQRSRATERLRR
jgi:hypothetical protein